MSDDKSAPVTADMTDLEMTKLCAEAMGYYYVAFDGSKVEGDSTSGKCYVCTDANPEDGEQYNPLHDDAQAMALVKKFSLTSIWQTYYKTWRVHDARDSTINADLNRAIVECVAKMQKEKNRDR